MHASASPHGVYTPIPTKSSPPKRHYCEHKEIPKNPALSPAGTHEYRGVG